MNSVNGKRPQLYLHPKCSETLATQLQAGLDYLQIQAELNLEQAVALLDVLQQGNLEAAEEAYILARPYYEQVEVLAVSFEDLDR